MGVPQQWMVYDVYEGKSHLEMDDDWGYTYFRKRPFGSGMFPVMWPCVSTEGS